MSEAKPTKGPWTVAGENSIEPDVMCGECFVAQCFGFDAPDEALANARLIADAGTVFHTTGLTPSQLVERVKELEELLRSLHERFRSCSVAGASAEEAYDSFYQFGVADVLSKARPNTAEGG